MLPYTITVVGVESDLIDGHHGYDRIEVTLQDEEIQSLTWGRMIRESRIR